MALESTCTMPADAVGFHNALFGAGVGPIHISTVDCRGDENNLLECSHSSALRCYRGHSEDAGVRCQGIIYICIESYYPVYYVDFFFFCSQCK